MQVSSLSERLPLSRLPWQSLAPYVRHLPRASTLLLTVLIAATLARIVWLMVPSRSTSPLPPPVSQTGSAAGSPRLDVEQIIRANMFGRAQALQANVAEAPETSLNLTLKGIFAASNPKASRALIAEASGKEKPYATGDDVPGGATLHSIEEDRVILERNGRYETLKLERNKSGGTPATVASAAPPPRAAGPINSLSSLKNEALRDPSVANQYVRVQPAYQEGKLAGYRVYPGPNSGLFQQAGLRAGELVTSVNGIQLDDTAKALQLMGDLRDIGVVTLTLERAGETRTVTLNLNQ